MEKTTVCVFLTNGCPLKGDACQDIGQEQSNCSEWQKRVDEKNLCPIMLMCGYGPENSSSLCEPRCLPTRQSLKKGEKCYDDRPQCLIVKRPEVQAKF